MISSTQIKWVRSLHQKKYRDIENLFLVEGEKLHQELFSSNFKTIKSFVTSEWLAKHQLKYHKREFIEVSNSQMQRISALKTSNKILSIVEVKNWGDEFLKAKKNNITLVLDSISDPGNLGTIIRTANWFGIKNIVCSPKSVEIYNPKVVQSTMGSIFYTPVHYRDLDSYLSEHKHLQIHGAMLNGENLFSDSLEVPSILVLGNESRGISPQYEKYLSKKILIPSFGKAESLNVTVACGIFVQPIKNLSFKNRIYYLLELKYIKT